MLRWSGHRWLWLVIAGAIVAVTIGFLAVVHYRDGRAAPSTPTPDEQAAGGPLVGDPTLVPDEQECIANDPNPPWFATMAAFEVSDSARTHLYECAHFLGATTGANDVLAYQSTDVYTPPRTTSSPEGPTTSTSSGVAMATTRPRPEPSSRASSRER